jgi:hypothetical protein
MARREKSHCHLTVCPPYAAFLSLSCSITVKQILVNRDLFENYSGSIIETFKLPPG